LTIHCKSLSELQPAAAKILKSFPYSRVFAFFGKLGTGKTTLIKSLCSEIGVRDIVQSPSFSIINEYRTTAGESVFHFDFYRILKSEEIFDLGYEEYLYSGSFCFIEWPEHMEELLPEDVVRINLEVNPANDSRTIQF
jgi:tRNA threonylcarbamoyladenosine biosynthesis protein TsaE